MPTKKQHYVPCTYLKAWSIENNANRNSRIYTFTDDYKAKESRIDSVCFENNLYTISFKYYFIFNSCSKICNDFVDQIYKLLRGSQPYIHGKIGYSVINTKHSIKKHLYEIDDWDFYYDNGNMASKKTIKNKIDNLKCYLLEDAFDLYFENNWEMARNQFINSVIENPILIDKGQRYIQKVYAYNIIQAFFAMFCRNPYFFQTEIYTIVKQYILDPIYDKLLNEGFIFDDIIKKEDMLKGIWFSQLYKIFYKHKKGYYNSAIVNVIDRCKIILYGTYESEGNFITSDNPAVLHYSSVESANYNAYYFPLSPKYLIQICRGDGKSVNAIEYRLAHNKDIRKMNSIIYQHRSKQIISNQQNITYLLL